MTSRYARLVLTHLEVNGPAPPRGRLAGVDVLRWHAPTTAGLDLRGSGVRILEIAGVSAPLTIFLPDALERLSLSGDPAGVRVEGAVPAGSAVSLWGGAGGTVPAWAAAAGELEIFDCARLDLAPVARMRHLRVLTVNGVGEVSGCASIAGATALERVAFYRCYRIDAAGFPHHSGLPMLEWLMADGVSAADAKILRERFDGFWNAHVIRPRSRAWLKRLREDPARAWTAWPGRVARTASALWCEAVSRLEAAPSAADREEAIDALAAALGRLAADLPADTLQREQMGETVRYLAAQHLAPVHPLTGWTPD